MLEREVLKYVTTDSVYSMMRIRWKYLDIELACAYHLLESCLVTFLQSSYVFGHLR